LKCAVISSRATPFCRRKNSACFPITPAGWNSRAYARDWANCNCFTGIWDFATISVTLPRQKLTNGIVRVKVVEGKLAKIKVEGNRHFSTNNILRALPSLDTNILLNTKWFQPELDRANANLDRQIYPVISPGLEPGTSDLTLKVKDRLPLHGHWRSTTSPRPGHPLLRLDSALQYNNLWQLNHQLGLEYNFSPQAMKGGDYSPNFLDQPMVSSYSGFYRIPLDGWPGVAGDIRAVAGGFWL
jgi:hemolysin activation/secretion protein